MPNGSCCCWVSGVLSRVMSWSTNWPKYTKPAGMAGMSKATSLSLTSCSGALPSFIEAASAISIASGGLNALRDLNMTPNRASAFRPDRTAMSLPRGLPTACEPRVARGWAGLAGAVGVRPGAAWATPCPSRGAAARAVRPASIDRRESRPPCRGSGAPAPLNGQTPFAPAVFRSMRAAPVTGRPRPTAADDEALRDPDRGAAPRMGDPAPQNRGSGCRTGCWSPHHWYGLGVRDLPTASPGVLHRCRLLAREQLVQG